MDTQEDILEQKNNDKSKKMGTMAIGKLLAMMSIPAMFSMMIQSLYNIVDGIFVSKYSAEALDAINIIMPMQQLLIAFAIGMAVGTNSLIARKLGEKNKKDASNYAKTGLIVAFLNYLLFVILAFTVTKFFCRAFSNNEETANLGTQYLTIIYAMSFGMFIESMLSKTLQATGNMIFPMFSQLIGAIVNIILDPIFIFGKYGFAEMGIKGAAYATIIGQVCSMIFLIIIFFAKKQEVSLNFKGYKPKKEYFVNIFKIGLPSMILNALFSFAVMAVYGIIKPLSVYSVSILGLYFKVESFVFMPLFGLNQGAMPILAYNYGANNKKRFKNILLLSLITALVIMSLGMLLFQFASPQLLGLFSVKGQMFEEGLYAFKSICWCFLPTGASIIMTCMFQSVGYGITSMILSILRQLVILIPVTYILKILFGLKGIWFCFSISELIVCLFFIPITIKIFKKVFKQKELHLLENKAVIADI